MENIHTLINVCKECNVYSVVLLPPQIFKVEHLKEYLITASLGYNFIYYHYPELYQYSNINLQNLLDDIPNMIGAKVVNDNSALSKLQTSQNIFVSADLMNETFVCTFVKEFMKEHIGTDKYMLLQDEMKINKKEKARQIIRYLYNLDLGPSRINKYNAKNVNINNMIGIIQS